MSGSGGKTHYEVLQVDRKASQAVLQGAYRALLKDAGNHPDLGGSQEVAQAITEAYSVLNDPVARGEYDRTLDLMHPALGFQPPLARTQYILICPSCRKPNPTADSRALEKVRCRSCGKAMFPRRKAPVETDHTRAFRMGLYLFEKKMLDRSLGEFQTAARLKPKEPNYHYWLGRCLYQTRNYEKSRQSFQAAATLSPLRFHFLFWIGQSNYALKNYADAVSSFLSARKARSGHSPTLLRLASSYFHLQEYARAIKVLEEAIANEPTRLQFYTLLGVIYLAEKNQAAALKAFQRAEQLSPGNAATRHYLGMISG